MAALSASCISTNADDLVEARLNEADSLFESGRYIDAVRLYDFVKDRRPMRKHAHVRAAHCYQKAGRPLVAVQIYEQVRDEIDSRDLFVLHNLAGLYMMTGFLPEAADTFKDILAINPNDMHAKMGLRDAIEKMARMLLEPISMPDETGAPVPGSGMPGRYKIKPDISLDEPPEPPPTSRGPKRPPGAPGHYTVRPEPELEPPQHPPEPPRETPPPAPHRHPQDRPHGAPGRYTVKPDPEPEPPVEAHPEPPPPAPRPEPAEFPRALLAEADTLVTKAAGHARRLATEDLPADRPNLVALRMIAKDASNLLESAVQKYREADRIYPMHPIHKKIEMAIQVMVFLDEVVDEIDRRILP